MPRSVFWMVVLPRFKAGLSLPFGLGDNEDDNPVGAVTSLNQVTSLVQGLKPDAGMVSVSYINSGVGANFAAQQIGQLWLATGGEEIDSSSPPAVWQNALVDLFAFPGGTANFRLSASPSIGTIQVYVNGVLTSAWAYDPNQNEIIFYSAQLPAAGSTVTVTYRPPCP